MLVENRGKMLIDKMRQEARKSPCKVIKFSASDGKGIFSHNGEFNPDCDGCKRTEIIQQYPDCTTNHAEWGILAKKNCAISKTSMYIYCTTPDEKDYPFIRFWCRTCAILIPMFGVKYVWMWNGNEWKLHRPEQLILEVETIRKEIGTKS